MREDTDYCGLPEDISIHRFSGVLWQAGKLQPESLPQKLVFAGRTCTLTSS